MKSIFFAISIMAFVLYLSANDEAAVQGNWNGSYRSISKISAIRIVFGQNNSVELYSSDFKNTGKANGTYKLSHSNKLEITCQWPDKDSLFIMNGRINPEGNFVNGEWEHEKQSNGTFYLARRD
jgi:hypothetical protein